MQFQKPAGTRDFYPGEMDARNNVLANLKSVCKRYGFSEADCPDMENTALLVAKSGEEIRAQVFNLEKKGDEEFSLRPEFTPSIARMFIEKQKTIQKPVKWFTFGRCWRYERPQKGRLREFFQLNAECFGSDSALADAEMISLAIDCLLSLGLKKEDFIVRINSRTLLESVLVGLNAGNSAEIFRIIDKKMKIPASEFSAELEKAGMDEPQIKKLLKVLETKDASSLAGSEGLQKVFEYLEKLGKKDFVEFDLSIARGIAYYTGTVFECFDRKGKLRAIFAGGRYDNLIEQLGGQPCPATGFAMGDVTLQLLLEDKKLWPSPELGVEYYIAPMDEKAIPFAIEVLNKLREKSTAEIDLLSRKISKQLDYASQAKAENAVIIGDEEVKTRMVTVKNMRTGKQEKMKFNEL
jgi:histidyl-tRNA synthetase